MNFASLNNFPGGGGAGVEGVKASRSSPPPAPIAVRAKDGLGGGGGSPAGEAAPGLEYCNESNRDVMDTSGEGFDVLEDTKERETY